VGTVFIGTTINYIDRQALSVAAPVIMEDLSLSNEQYGWIVSSFLLSYAIMQFLSGRFIDKVGVKKGFSVAVIWWSIANMLHALSSGFRSLSAFRFLLGMGEAANYPTAMKAISSWFPDEEKSKAVGILNMGPGLGAIIAPPLMAWLITAYNWKVAFIITGSFGFVWLLWWLWVYHEPKDHPKITQDELKLIPERNETESTLKWYDYFKYKEVWGLSLARFVSDGAFYFFVFWLPNYLSSEKGLDLIQIGMFAWIPFLAADIGSFTGGWAGSKLIDKGMSLDASRKYILWLGSLAILPIMSCIYIENISFVFFIISFTLFSLQFKQSSLFTLPIDLFEQKDAASVWGITGSAGSFGAMLFTPVIGWLVDNMSYNPVFVIVAFLHLISTIIIVYTIPTIKKLKPIKI